MPLTLTMSTEEKVRVTVAPLTEAGNPAPIDGAVLFLVESGTCTIEPIDATSAYVVSGAAGTSVILTSADADLGGGVTTLADTITATVTDALAEQLGVAADAPILK